jgi:hypothetical protein
MVSVPARVQIAGEVVGADGFFALLRRRKERIMEFKLRRAVPVAMAIGVAAALAVGTSWRVAADGDERSAETRCSNRTLRGDYGFDISGTILAGPKAGLLRGVAMTHFDGDGNLSQVDFVTNNGVPGGPDWRPATGTYDLNPNCTGTAEIVFSDGSPTLHLWLVASDRGREIRTVVVGNPTGSAGTKVR